MSLTGAAENDARGRIQSSQRSPVLDTISMSCQFALVPTFGLSLRQQKYYRVKAYRVKMLAKEGNLSIDGEPYPYENYEVEAHPGLARTLSPTGRFFVDDFHN